MNQEVTQKTPEVKGNSGDPITASQDTMVPEAIYVIPSQYPHTNKNIYPSLRHILLTSFVIMCMALILFLIHQNGKSIYDNGL